jgi:CDP-glucose 4,6-dehydratase
MPQVRHAVGAGDRFSSDETGAHYLFPWGVWSLTRNFWLNRPVLVTGATGLVGNWLTRRLIEAGADVACVVRDWVPCRELVRSNVDQITVVRGDGRYRDVLERTIVEYETDTVIYLAAHAIVGVAIRNPISTFEPNIQGTWNLLEACPRSTVVTSIVVASSDKAWSRELLA